MLAKALVCALFSVAVSGAVVELNNNNFDEVVNDASKDVLVKFFAPWCGHCTRMAPAWKELGDSDNGADVVIASLDADANRDAGTKAGVQGFPTIKLYKKADKSGQEYQGGRDVASFKSFLKTNL